MFPSTTLYLKNIEQGRNTVQREITQTKENLQCTNILKKIHKSKSTNRFNYYQIRYQNDDSICQQNVNIPKKNYNIHIRLSENYKMKIKSDWETHKGIACVQ